MGFREGEGLGKFGQGRKEIVEASTQRGRRGLGLTLQGFQGELNIDWRDEPEVNNRKKNEPLKVLVLVFIFSVVICLHSPAPWKPCSGSQNALQRCRMQMSSETG